MSTPARVAGFLAGLAVAFGAAFAVGRVADLGMPRGSQGAPGTSTHGDGHGGDRADGHGTHSAPAAATVLPGGLQVAQDGYRLVLDHPRTSPAPDARLTFRIIGPDDAPLTRYTPVHDKELHLILVRRDLSGYSHLHPVRAADGTWSVATPLTPGAWRVFADFDPAGEAGAPMTLGADLFVEGPLTAELLPPPATTATVDGYTVTLRGDLRSGRDSRLTLSVSRDGRPVRDLQPYLAAYGHLVALREGDLAYLHVHPDGAPGDGRTAAGPDIVFHTTAPSAGRYRLYLDFQHAGVVRTAEFTVQVGQDVPHAH